MSSYTFLLYTHSDYEDVLSVYLQNHKKYLADVPVSVAVNNAEWIHERFKDTFQFQTIYEYTESLPFAGRMEQVLKQIQTPYVLFNQEINVIVDYPSPGLLEKIINFMNSTNATQVRLSDSGLKNIIRNDSMFQLIEGDFYMSVISAVWRTSSLLELYSRYKMYTYRTIEHPEVQHFVATKFRNFYISSPYDVEHLPLHALSYHFPSIHVTHWGKWCIHSTMNNYYVRKLLDTYGIDPMKRGFYSH
jgi:hypothetical protein